MATQNNFPMWPRHDIIKAEALCSICGHRFDFMRLQVLDEQEGSTLLYIRCAHCLTGSLSAISMGHGKLHFATTPTDLAEDEILRMREEDRVTSDEVLEIHANLESQDNFLDNI